jgi:methylated-DNA-[protein]-cysteine S-methyltransferase
MKAERLVSFCCIESPIGRLTLTSDGTALTGLYMASPGKPPPRSADWVMDPTIAPLPEAARQLREYFAGERRVFDLPLRLHGTDFQKRVWQQLTAIPFGETWSYGQLARSLDNPNACRAVGLANGNNPIAIIVPCHRVIGADGSLTGFGGGLPRKQWLLAHEGISGTQALMFG